MGHKGDGNARPGHNLDQVFGKGFLGFEIKIVEWLVEKKHRGLEGKGSGKGQSAQLPARKSSGSAICESRNAEVSERLRNALFDLFVGQAPGP